MAAGARTTVTSVFTALGSGGLLALAAGCTTQVTSRDAFAPSQVKQESAQAHLGKLADLPLRFDARDWHLNLRPQGLAPSAVREAYLLRDTSKSGASEAVADGAGGSGSQPFVGGSGGDTVFVVYDDLLIQSVSANDFRLNWTSRLDHRVPFAPVMTAQSVMFVDMNGDFQQFARDTGRLVKMANFGLNYYPSAPITANSNYVVVPTSNPRSVRGWPDVAANTSSLSSQQKWDYPAKGNEEDIGFEMVQLQPVADASSVYFISNNNTLYGVSAKDGSRSFAKSLGKGAVVKTPPVLSGGVIYCGSDTQLFAFDRSGEALWTYTTTGMVEGPIYALDDQVFFRTSEFSFSERDVGRRYRGLGRALTTQVQPKLEVSTTPSQFASVKFTRSSPPIFDNDAAQPYGQPKPLKKKEGEVLELDREVVRGPLKLEWSLENLGQEVLLKTKDRLYVVMADYEVPYTPDQIAKLRKEAKAVRDSELRVCTKRVLQVLDPATGKLLNNGGEPASYDMTAYDFILGSMEASDRAIYIVTKDGHLFKGFGQ